MRDYQPCLCGDPECRRCFPGTAEDDGYSPCECCGGSVMQCKCEYATGPVYDPDGRPTGAEEDYCVTHSVVQSSRRV